MTEIEARTSERAPVAPSGPRFVEADVLDDAGHVDVDALDRLEAELRAEERWEDLVRLLRLAAERCPSAARTRRAWLDIGDIWRRTLGAGRRAEPFYARVVASDPDCVPALEGLRAIALAGGRWDEAADLTERVATLHHGHPEAAARWLELAELARLRLDHPERALRALSRARAEDPSRKDVLEAALDLLVKQERWNESVRVLEDLETLVEQAGPAARAELAARYRDVAERLSRHALHHRVAEACLARARELGDDEALSRLDELAAARADWQQRAQSLVAEGLEARDKHQAADLYIRAAEMHLVYGRDPVKADEHLNRALILRGYRPALAYLEAVFLGRGKGEELVKRLNALLAGVRDAPTRIEVSMRIARLMTQIGPRGEQLTEMLISLFERVLALDPGHREAARACTALLTEIGRHDDVARVLENHLASLDDEYSKVVIHLQLGRLYAEVLGDSSRACAHFEAIMAMRPTHYPAATALRALYRDADEAPLLLDVLRVLLEYMPDVEMRKRLLDEMEVVADTVSAEERYAVARRKFDLFPADDDLRADFTRRSRALQRDLTLAQSLERAAGRLPAARAVALLRAAAEVYDERLPRPEDAVRCLRAALAIEPDDAAMQEALERLLRQQDDPRSLAELLESQLRRAATPDEQTVLESKLGEVLFKELDDLDGAAARFEAILAREPENPTALAQLDDLYGTRGDAAAQEAVLARRDQIARDPETQLDVRMRRARLLAQHLNQPSAAADIYLGLLDEQPDRSGPVDALAELLQRGVREADIARALERHYARRGETARQVEMLAILVRSEMHAEARKELALRAAHLCDARLGSYGPAFDYLAVALALDPADEAVKDHLLEASQRLRAPERAVQVFATILERDDLEPEVIASLAQSTGELLERELEDPSGAADAYRRVLEADPGSTSAVAALQRILGGLGQHRQLAELLENRLETAASGADRGRLLMALADVRERQLGDVAGALEACRKASVLSPDDAGIRSRLIDLLERAGRRRELVGLLEQVADAAPTEDVRASARARIGDALRADGDFAGAVEAYAATLAIREDHPTAVAGLEACLHEPAVAGRAGGVLAPLYRAQDRPDDEARARAATIPTTAAGPERSAAWRELARLHDEGRADPSAAFDAWARAFNQDPTLGPADHEDWERVAIASRRARELAGIWSSAVEGAAPAPDPELLRRLARLWDGAAAEPARAKATWAALLEAVPGDLEALEALERLTDASDPERLLGVLEARAEVEPDAERKAALHRRAASLAEESLGDSARAARQLEAAVAARPSDLEGVRELARIHERRGDWARRRAALEREVELEATPVARADARVALGRCLVELSEPDAAIDQYREALELVPDHSGARAGLEALLDGPAAEAAATALEPVYRAAGDWPRLVQTYEVRARATPDPRAALEQWVAIRAMWEDRLGQVEPALEAALECVARDPESAEHWAALERLAVASGDIEPAVRRSEAWVEAADASDRARRAVRHAERLEGLGAEGARVAAAWSAVREQASEEPDVLRALAGHYERSGRMRELAETLSALAQRSPGTEQVALHRQVGELWADRLAVPEEAARAFERVLELEPDDVASLARLDELYARLRRSERRAEILERRARVEVAEARVRHLMALAALRAGELEDPSAALAPLKSAVELGASDAVDALEALMRDVRARHPHVASRAAALLLEPLERAGEVARRAEALEIAAAGADDPDERFRLRRARARLCETQLGQPELAFAALVQAHRDAPSDRPTVDDLERLAAETENREELADLLAHTVSGSEDAELRARLARLAAELYEHALDRPDAALAMIRVVREHDPADVEAFATLQRLAKREGDAHQRVELYRTLIDETPDGPERAELWLRIADIAETDLSDADLAYDAFRGWAESGGDDPDVRRKFEALCERTGRLDELGALLEADARAAVAAGDFEEARRGWLRLGVLHRDRRDDPAGAVAAFGEALRSRPGDEGALEGLRGLLSSAPSAVAARAARELLSGVEPSAFETRVEAHAVLAESSAELEDRRDHWLEASRLAGDELGWKDRAFDYAVRAVYEDPGDPDVRARVEAGADAAGRWPDLTTVYESVLSGGVDADTAYAIHTVLARRHERDGDAARAIAEYQMALERAPNDADTLAALERLLEGEGDFAQLSEVFRRRIAATDDPGPKVSLMRQFADLLALRMEDLGAAISTLRRLLEIEPNDQAALIKLDRWLAEQGRGSERREILQRLVSTSEDPSVRHEARLRWAELEASDLGNPARGVELAAANLTEAPRHERTRAWLEQRVERALREKDRTALASVARALQPAYHATEDWNALISLLRSRAELTLEAAARAELLAEIAELYEHRLDQPDLAFATLVEAIRLAPGREDLRASAESLAPRHELAEELVDAYLEIAPSTADPEAAVALLRHAARELDRGEADPERAEATWQDIVRRLPDDPEALAALEAHARRRDDAGALARALERRAANAGDRGERFSTTAELGRLYAERFRDRERAVTFLRAAHELKPEDRGVALALARVLDAERDAAELYAVFEQLERGADRASDKIPVLLRMGHLAETALGRSEDALEQYARVLELEPGNAHAFGGLERLYEAAGRWSDLVRLVEARIEHTRDPDERLALQRKLGSLRATRLGSPDEAIAAWTLVTRENPNDFEALMALRQLYRQQGQWEGLIGTLRRLLTLHNEPEPIKEVRFELAEVLLDHQQSPSEAVDVARRVLDIEPHTAAELFRLEELLARAGAHGEAVKAKLRRAELSDEIAEKIEVLEEVAEIYESQIRRTAGAIQTYEQILELDPRHHGAFDALARLYEQHGDHRSLVDLIGRRLAQSESLADRCRLHLRVAELQERALGSKDLAFAAACAAFTEGGATPEAQATMQRLAVETDNEDMLADVLEDQVENVDFERALELRLEVAKLAARRTDEPERAERHLEMLLAMQPGHPEASELLEELLRAAGRDQDLVLHLRDQAELVTDPARVRALLEQVAQLEETQLGRRDAAIQTWSRLAERFPEDTRATRELERLYRDDGRSEALLDLLDRRYESADDATRVEISLQIARIREHDLGQTEHAIESLRAALELDPGHAEALEALERLYAGAERWRELLGVYERQLAIATTPDEVVAISTRMAAVHEERLGDPEAAIETYERIFDTVPGHLATAKSLARLLRPTDRAARRAEVLELIRAASSDPKERAAVTRELAGVLADHLDRVDAAEALHRELLEQDPGSEAALRGLAELAERRRDWPAAVDGWRRLADVVLPEAAIEVHHRIGVLAREHLGDVETAGKAFERALDLDPRHVASLTALRELAEGGGDPGRLLELLEREAEAEPDGDRRAQQFHRAANVALDGFDDVDRAVSLLERALAAVPAHREALTELSELLFSDEQYEAAVPYVERLIDRLDPDVDRLELGRQHYRRAYVAEREGDAPTALEHYLASYEADPSYLPTLEGLGAALVEAERFEDASRIFQTILVQHRESLTDAEIVDLHHEVGDLALRMGQLDRAKKSLLKALEIDPRHVATLGSLAELSEKLDELEEAYDFRERMIEQLADPDARFQALVRQGDLCRERIGEPYRAIDAYNEARSIQPDALEVQRALIPLLESTRQFSAAAQLSISLAETVEDPTEQRDLLVRAGDLQWEKERAWAGAADAYNRALDIDPMYSAALQRLEAMLAEAKQWKALEENYIRMIRRLPKENKKARVALWKTLGELYTRVLADPAGAARAYEVVFGLEPGDPEVGLTLAQIYRRHPEKRREAASICQKVLPLVPDPTPAARLFAELAYEQGQYDAAFCGLGGLVLLRAAQEEEVRAYRALLDKAPAWPAGGVTDGQWKRTLLHPECRGALGALVSGVYRHAPELFSAKRRELALKKKERVDLAEKGRNAPVRLRYFDVWGRVASALGIRDVDHYRRSGSVDSPLLLPGGPKPALYVGEQHEVFKTMPARQVAWLVGRQMAAARPELAPVRALSPGDFLAMVEAALQIFETSGGFAQQIEPRVIQAWSKALRSQLTDAARAELGPLAAEVSRQGSLQNYAAYFEGAEHSVSRAALLVCGDWITASRGLGEADALADMPRERRVRELLVFSTSAELLALRKALSLEVQV